jgi:protein SCO1/2
MKLFASTVLFISIFTSITAAQVVLENADDLQKIDVTEHLGDTIPLNLRFVNSTGDTVRLTDYFHQDIPIILSLHYTNCPMLCSLVLNGLTNGVKQLAWQAGDKYQMLSISIDPEETPDQSAAIKDRYLATLGKHKGPEAWDFLIGDETNINQLTGALGFQYFYIEENINQLTGALRFQYFYIEETQEFAHPAVVFVLTETGVVSRYLYGIEFKEQDLRLALLEASEGKIGNTIDRLILFCYHYDPDAEGYVVFAANIMKLGGVATVIILGLFLGILWGRERHRKAKI